jgi:hypothetical protein
MDEEDELAHFAKKFTPTKERTRYGSALKSSATSIFRSASRRSWKVGEGAAGNDENDGRASNKSDEMTKSIEKS